MSFEGPMKNPFAPKPEQYIPKQVPESECDIRFVRGSGAGGQKVNKTSSTAELHWNLERSGAFTPEEKARLRDALGAKLTAQDEIVIKSNEQRSQSQNKEAAIARLNMWVAEALRPVVERVATKPTKGSQARRLDDKARDAQKKAARGSRFSGDE